jgi:hypothetical protein
MADCSHDITTAFIDPETVIWFEKLKSCEGLGISP